MHLEELMNPVIVAKLSTTLLKTLNPVEACILNIQRKTLIHLALLHLGGKCSWQSKTAHVPA
jgi:hypothetical protein